VFPVSVSFLFLVLVAKNGEKKTKNKGGEKEEIVDHYFSALTRQELNNERHLINSLVLHLRLSLDA